MVDDICFELMDRGRMLMLVVKWGWVLVEEEGGDGKKEEGMLWEDGKMGE